MPTTEHTSERPHNVPKDFTFELISIDTRYRLAKTTQGFHVAGSERIDWRPPHHTPESWLLYLFHLASFENVSAIEKGLVFALTGESDPTYDETYRYPPIILKNAESKVGDYARFASDLIDETPKVTRNEWLDALESGQYCQIRSDLFDLREDPEYEVPPESEEYDPPYVLHGTCCIGVAPLLRGVPFEMTRGEVARFKDGELADPNGTLSGSTMETGAASRLIADFTVADESLAVTMNDDAKMNFAEIATTFRLRWNMSRATATS